MPNELPVVRRIAAQIHTHFPGLPESALVRLLDAAFWASLRREEGFTPTISLAYLAPEESPSPILFDRRLPLEPESLARLAPAVERPGIHLGVLAEADELYVWGATRPLPKGCFVLEVVAPGLIVVKQRGHDDVHKFANSIELSSEKIFGLDRNMNKIEVLKGLMEAHPNEKIYFVEDRFPTLLNVLKNPELASVKLILALWGYNTSQDKTLASEKPITLQTLEDFLEG